MRRHASRSATASSSSHPPWPNHRSPHRRRRHQTIGLPELTGDCILPFHRTSPDLLNRELHGKFRALILGHRSHQLPPLYFLHRRVSPRNSQDLIPKQNHHMH
ncbi:hypothetical protein Rs2_13792 [Raphanus sativus]|nr:hypothetical protein Rs2_50779 [Raphanus sativus]KAJ4899841.1 hypothetical protein Rs2_13792 [Raphanus sativus]